MKEQSQIMSKPIQVAITRTVKPGYEAAFEQALHDFVQRTLSLAGQMGVHIIRPAPGSGSRQYGIIRHFADREALAAFHTSPEYLEWNHIAQDLTEGSGHIEELNGLESWFTLPGAPLCALPKWKMALVTFIGVDIISIPIFWGVGPMIQNWPFLVRISVLNGLIVASLTWLGMPLLTRVLKSWLQPEKRKISK